MNGNQAAIEWLIHKFDYVRYKDINRILKVETPDEDYWV